MTLTLTIASLRGHEACGLDERIADLRCALPDVEEDTPVPLRVWWDLPSTSISDRWWSLRAVEPQFEGQRLGVRAAALAARRVLHLERERDRPVCLAAIEAAEAWAEDPTPEQAEMARAAAAAAPAYTAAAAAAYAAAAAAAANTDADAYAAASYAYAANAAAAVRAADREAQRLDLDRLLDVLEAAKAAADDYEDPRLMVYEARKDGEWRQGWFLGAFRMEPTAEDIIRHLDEHPEHRDAVLAHFREQR